ncbi:hypothetical protein [Roseomonas sp. WA12]
MRFPISIGSRAQKSAANLPVADVSDTSRIVISFNNANGGHLFAHWIRNELMKGLNYFAQNSVYLDNVAARNNFSSGGAMHHNGLGGPGQGYWEDPRFKQAMDSGVPLIGPNRAGGPNYATIGGMHTRWEEMWTGALRTSKVLIQLQTQDYLDASKKEVSPCARELGRINAALASGSINVLALRFGDIPEAAINLSRGAQTTSMLVSKVHLGMGGGGSTLGQNSAGQTGSAFEGAYKLSPTDLQRVLDFCRSKGC